MKLIPFMYLGCVQKFFHGPKTLLRLQVQRQAPTQRNRHQSRAHCDHVPDPGLRLQSRGRLRGRQGEPHQALPAVGPAIPGRA